MKSANIDAYSRLVERLADARNAAKCTQAELGSRLGKPQSFVSKVESRERMLDLVEFVHWAKALQVDPASLVTALADELRPLPRQSKQRKSVPAALPPKRFKPRKTVPPQAR